MKESAISSIFQLQKKSGVFNYQDDYTMFSFAKKLVDRLEGTATGNDPGNSDSYFGNCLQLNNQGYGLRVLHVEPQSLGHKNGFESWFDYIIRVNNHELPMMYPYLAHSNYRIGDDGTINYGGNENLEQVGMVNFDLLKQEIVASAKNVKQITFDVWSAKGGIVRLISVPLTESSTTLESIGLTLQSQHLNTATYVWRILATHIGSPGFQAQLIPYSDYVIGCDAISDEHPHGKGLLSSGGETLLSRTIQNYYNLNYTQSLQDCVPITLYVYNHDYDILRPVTVNLNRSWGQGQNRGILGCDVGYGLLHRIPEVVGKFDNGTVIEDVLFENQQEFSYAPSAAGAANESFTPTHAPPPPVAHATSGATDSLTAPPPRSAATRKLKHVPADLSGLNDYMNEELENSKKLDSNIKTGSNSTLPPPPPSGKLTQ